jgi:GNAT superfamily N-acetyltransferase
MANVDKPFKATITPEHLYSWESQVRQYPYQGEPGIEYHAGVIKAGIVHCLLYRNDKGHIRGILNYFDFESEWQKPGDVNIWVRRGSQGQGIGRALWLEAKRRWGVSLEAQRNNMTPAGAAFANALMREESENDIRN